MNKKVSKNSSKQKEGQTRADQPLELQGHEEALACHLGISGVVFSHPRGEARPLHNLPSTGHERRWAAVQGRAQDRLRENHRPEGEGQGGGGPDILDGRYGQ